MWATSGDGGLGVRAPGSSPAAEKVQDLGLAGLGGRHGAPPALN